MATIKYEICEFDDGILVAPMIELEYSLDRVPRFYVGDSFDTMEEACAAIDEYGEPGIGYAVLMIVTKEED